MAAALSKAVERGEAALLLEVIVVAEVVRRLHSCHGLPLAEPASLTSPPRAPCPGSKRNDWNEMSSVWGKPSCGDGP